jgi:ppGpp synthetase/RelA/SpoT-type nucleotidyltranferase
MTEQETPKATIEDVLAEFDAKENALGQLCVRTKSLIEAILQDAGISYQSIQFRVKSAEKLKKKFLNPEKNYKRLEDITDLAGLRIITYYEGDIDRVSEIIKAEFDIDLRNSVDKREVEPDRFGYSALNYVCRHSAKRASDVEYKKFSGILCEIQITSILRHAWSELEHEWYDLKDAYPKAVKRRFYRIAALLELAESEFQDIRKQRTEYERSVAVRVEAGLPDLPVDAVSLKLFIEQEPIVRELDKSLASSVGLELTSELPDRAVEGRAAGANQAGISKLQDLGDLLKKCRKALLEFVTRCNKEVWPAPSSHHSPPGLCVHLLSLFLVSKQGKDKLLEFLKLKGIASLEKLNLDLQVAIAQEIAAKYSV